MNIFANHCRGLPSVNISSGQLPKKVIKNKSNAKSNRFPTNPWFDNECKNIKHLCTKLSKTRDLSVSIYRKEYHDLRKKYKNIIQDSI